MAFWLNNFSILWRETTVLPKTEMTLVQKLNALTRLLILVTLAAHLLGYSYAIQLLGAGLMLIIIVYARNCNAREGFKPRRGVHDPCRTCGMDSSMAYINSKYETTPMNQYQHVNDGLRSYVHAHYKVIPVDTPAPYRNTWQNEPRMCNEFTQTPESYTIPSAISADYEFVNIPLPVCIHEDSRWVDVTSTGKCSRPGKISACPAAQPAFMRDSLEYRNNIMGEYVDQFNRQRNHLCVGFKPGRKTF